MKSRSTRQRQNSLTNTPLPNWLDYARRLAASAQTGLHFAADDATRRRYHAVRHLAAEIAAAHSTLDLETALHLLGSDTGYATPRVAVGGVLLHENRLLLVQQADDQGWSLPIGWAEINEAPAATAVREVFEESGLDVRAVGLIGIYDQNLRSDHALLVHRYLFLYRCELVGAPITAFDGSEILDARFFTPEEINTLRLSPIRVTHALLERCFAHAEAPTPFVDLD